MYSPTVYPIELLVKLVLLPTTTFELRAIVTLPALETGFRVERYTKRSVEVVLRTETDSEIKITIGVVS